MTLPGKMLTDSVARLADSIAAARKVSEELKGGTIPGPPIPIPVGEVSREQGDSGRQEAP